MHKMWNVAIDNPGVSQSVSLSVCHAAERIEVLLLLETFDDPRNIALE